MKKIKTENIIFAIGLFSVVFVRLWYLIKTQGILGGDEAVFGLMAQHIFEGQEFPIFLWGNHYSGTISCYIASIFYSVFGTSGYSFKLVMVIWEILGIFLFSLLFSLNIRWIIPVFFIFFPSNIFIITPFVELFPMAMLSLLLIKKFIEWNFTKTHCFLFGLINGFGVYHQPLFIPYFLAVIFMIYHEKIFKISKYRIITEMGFLIGFSPCIVYNLIHPFATLGRLAGRILSDGSGIGKLQPCTIIQNIPDTFGYGLILLFIIGLVVVAINREIDILRRIFLCLVICSLAFYFFPGVQKDRYLSPVFYACLGFSVLFFEFLYCKKKIYGYSFIVVFFTISFLKFYPSTKIQNPSYQELISYLKENNMKYAYSDYWLSYPVTFHSKEEIIVSPRANDASGFYDRYTEYTNLVKQQSKKCFIFDERLKWSENLLLGKLESLKVKYVQQKVAEFSCVIFDYSGDDKIFLTN